MRSRWLPLCALLAAIFVPSVRADEKVYEKVLSAVCQVTAGNSTGSGAVVDQSRRLILTNHHVIGGAAEALIVFPQFEKDRLIAESSHYVSQFDKLAIKGKVIFNDPRRDLALIEVEKLPARVKALSLSVTGAKTGQRIHSVGNPVSSGARWVYVSGTVRQVYDKTHALTSGQTVDARVVETQSPINPGDSGGPVVNDEGELVAVVSSFLADARVVSHAIDVSDVKAALKGENKTIDARVSKALDKLKLKYVINVHGVYRLQFNMADGGEHVVFIDSTTSKYEGFELRKVWSITSTVEGSFSAEVANKLLILTSTLRVGAHEVQLLDSKSYAVLGAKLSANAAPELLHSLVQGVLASSYQTKKEIEKLTPPSTNATTQSTPSGNKN